MREFKSLKASGLADDFDAEVHGEEPLVEVEENEDNIEISYLFPGFFISEDEQSVDGENVTLTQVDISGTGFFSQSGKPLLPSFGRFVNIPPGHDFKFTVKKGRKVEFGNIFLAPAQEKATDDDSDEEGEFEFDSDAYSKDELYPKDMVEVDGPYEIDGYKALRVHVRPLQYNPAARKLVGHSNITVKIEFTEKDESDNDIEPFLTDSSHDRRAFGNMFINPVRRKLGPLVLKEVKVGPLFAVTPEFLIIHADGTRKSAEKLADWKNTRGLTTTIRAISKIGNDVTKIKKYIRALRGRRFGYRFSRLRYVLFFGDVDTIVTEPISGGTFGSNVTDYYYTTPKDPADGTDLVMPWLSGGRIPVNDESEGMKVVDQIIRYERTPPSDSEYYRRILLAAYFQDNSPQDGKANRAYMKTMEGVRDHMVSLGFDAERSYVSNNPNPQLYKDGTPVPQEVKDAIVDGGTATNMLISETSDGQLVVGHRDHGGTTGWSHPSFKSGDLDSLTSKMPSIFHSINCLTGKFDLNNPQDCFAEAMLKLNGGAPSLVAATRLSGTWRNDSLIKALFDALWPGMIPTFPGTTASYPIKNNRLGDILNYGKSYLLVAHSGGDAGIKDHLEIYHVIGDPTLELWTDVPLRISLRAFIKRGYLQVMMSRCPRGCVLTVWNRDKLIKQVRPASRMLKIPLRNIRLLGIPHRGASILPPFIRYPISVCFYAPGYRFVRVGVRNPYPWLHRIR